MITKELIEFDTFLEVSNKLDIRIGQIVSVERVPKSTKMLKMSVIFGEEEKDEKTVMTNIGGKFSEDDLLGLTFPFIVNLVPSKIMGVMSEAMILVNHFKNEVGDEIYLENRIGANIL